MTKSEKTKRDAELMLFLTTPIGIDNNGQPIYPSESEAEAYGKKTGKWNLSQGRIHVIKVKHIGLDREGGRKR